MTITLLAPTSPDISAFGVRALSAYLKLHGKEVRLIFLPGGVEKFKYRHGFKYEYDKHVVEQVVELCRGSGLVGISFMSNYLDRAMQLAAAVKSALDVPLAVGGIHPTVMPEECLNFADIVCVGEGEEAVLELVNRIEQGMDYSDIKNLCVRKNGSVIRNPLRPLTQNLDDLPHYDFSLDGHYVYDNIKKSIEPMTKDLLKRSFPLEPHLEGSFNDSYKRTISYKTLTTRGCPHHCTFCAEKTLADMYTGQRYLRKRGFAHIMEELLWVKRELPFVESIFLFDDTFLVRSNEEIKEFSKIYKETIGLPFHIQASPSTVTEEKMQYLTDAGLVFVEMGIQSMSTMAKDLYKRNVSEESILKAAAIFHKYRHKIYPPCYHVILDNPWEKPEDVIETLSLVLKLPSPFWLKRASLVCFPGTDLYNKARRDEIIQTEEDEWREIYAKHLHTPHGSYVNFLMYLAGFSRLPRAIISLLSRGVFVNLLEKEKLTGLYNELNRLGETSIIAAKGLRSLLKGDFRRIYRYFIKVTSKTS
ncbi:B12-binding domain-containing radical SAM protein [Candidatus Magnetominusculus xianensis]|uniref:B12-binding domain-containing radical SAM protein n=1 Tax=Candidatus Magnetominusculus xianensis TaxID=1748249 RepID=A0ABR5SDF0_9BACT|nr:radical SAM protein [Candidatus Magnetominusculus xianensis]KWT82966.1 B12-binding domain-containing radical SAM protein [Candidatus Magnetominusculus xianensis]MBF0403045.1 B12-binding domain-containing radical SAM protein [Nitrospirota bacterium]